MQAMRDHKSLLPHTHTLKQSRQTEVAARQKINDRNIASRFWGTGEARSAGFISVCKPDFPLRFRGPGN